MPAMLFQTWLLYFLTDFVMTITPGPAVLLISSQGMRYGWRPSVLGVAGVSLANLIYFVLSALGLGALLLSAERVFDGIRIVGAAYLVFLGVKLIWQTVQQKSDTIPAERTVVVSQSKLFLQGFTTHASNPKAILFYVALLPQFIDNHRPVLLQFSILALTTIVQEFLLLTAYGWLAAKGSEKMGQSPLVRRIQDRVAGSVLIGLGINLFLLKRPGR